MNRNLSILMLLLVAACSCGKHAEKGKVLSGGSLLGKWEYTEHFYSTGSPGKWHPVQPAGQLIEFKPDGTFSSVASFSGTFVNYEVIDSTTVKFTPAPTSSSHVLMRYEIDEAQGSLLLYPIDPICIEGCSSKFKRSK